MRYLVIVCCDFLFFDCEEFGIGEFYIFVVFKVVY